MALNERIGRNYVITSLGSLLLAMLIGLTLKTLQLTPLTEQPSFNLGYRQALTLHGLIMMYLFILPIFHGGFSRLVLAANFGCSSTVWARFSSFGLHLHGVGAVALVAAVWLGEYRSGWMIEPPDMRAGSTTAQALLLTAFIMINLARWIDAMDFLLTAAIRREFRQWVLESPFLLSVLAVSVAHLFLPIGIIALAMASLGGAEVGWSEAFLALRPSVYLISPCGLALLADLALKKGWMRRSHALLVSFSAISLAGMSAFRLLLRWAVSLFPGLVHSISHLAEWLMASAALPLLAIAVVYASTLIKARRAGEPSSIQLWTFIALAFSSLLLGVATGLYTLVDRGDGVTSRLTYFLVAHFHVILISTNLVGVLAALAERRSPWPGPGRRFAVIATCGIALTFLPMFLMSQGVLRHQPHISGYPMIALAILSLGGAFVLVASVAWLLFELWPFTSSSLSSPTS